MEKVIRDGKVAVLVSHGSGAGWYSWNGKHQELLFHPKIVELVEQNKHSEITEQLCQELLGTDEYICVLGVDGLLIHWLPIGTAFEIEEYHGDESLRTIADLVLVA
ncbi:MAG: hypothetical protein F2563_03590 [Actinobacteria bacterium]|uniref:Unannotated protein n=1 Tax=freshwater metagenome TaxID=449393 RepID=A0A6J6ERG9_9ZZZZ|nr:hypothetical protein [Actinomycetota bacterium]